jgi:hypothetical protein
LIAPTGAAQLVVNLFRLVAGVELRVVDLVRPRLQMVISVIFKTRAMHLVRSGFGLRFTAAPPPDLSASKLLVTMLTSWKFDGGDVETTCGSKMLCVLTPSTRVLF